MKTHVVMLAAIALCCHGLKAQEARRFYVKVDAGYAMSMAGKPLLTETTQDIVNNTSTTKSIIGTYGQGLKTSLGVGYMFGPHFGLELGGVFSLGATHKSQEDDFISTPSSEMAHRTVKLNNTTGLVYLQGKMVLNSIGNWTPYGRLGAAMNVYAKSYEEKAVTTSSNDFTSNEKTESNYRVSLGVNAALGCSYRLNSRLSLYGEVNTLIMSLNRKKSTVTSSTINGSDALHTYTTFERETEYGKNAHTAIFVDQNAPRQEASVFDPLSYVGISLGIQIAI